MTVPCLSLLALRTGGLRFPLAVGFSLLLSIPLLGGEKEEPDFFFMTGGPYTQAKHSPQLIWANQWIWMSGGQRVREYTGAGRFEFGLTDRWEADFEFGAIHSREEFGSGGGQGGITDFLIGARYRLLDESFAPLTLTLGPQIILPSASRDQGFGHGEPGFALDVSGAKDWGGPVFVAASLNVLWTPGVPAPETRSRGEADLTDIETSLALAWRPVERSTEYGRHHDIHTFFEVGWSRIEEPDRSKTREWTFSPGVRYGFMSAAGVLTEIGVALPIGLNRDAPDRGWILQAQIEWP